VAEILKKRLNGGRDCTTLVSMSTLKRVLEVPEHAQAYIEVLIDGVVQEVEIPVKLASCDGASPRLTLRWRET